MPVGNVPLLYRRPARLALAITTVAVIVLITVSAFHWPFTERAVIQSLEDASCSRVTIRHFRATYFPHPGCVAEKLTFRRQPTDASSPPMISIRMLIIQSSFFGLITRHVALIRADGMEIFIAPGQAGERFCSSSNTTVDELTANGATLSFGSRDQSKSPTRFAFHQSTFHNIGGQGVVLFRAKFSNPEPPGEVNTMGTFGPWRHAEPLQTPVSGEYSFEFADLGAFKGISGTLSSNGQFQGVLEHIDVHGATETPDFKVTSSSHQVRLRTQFRAFVNARTGDVVLDQVDATFGRTLILAAGSVAREASHKGRITELNMQTKDGRIQDLFVLFIRDKRSPITGVTNFRAHVTIPPEKHPFLKQVRLSGDFGIQDNEFTRPTMQGNVDKLSAEARGQNDNDPDAVLSDLKGHVELKNGVATFSSLSFAMPGAFAQLHGTYDLISEKTDLHGTLKMDSTFSHIAHGPKSILLKIMDPFFKKKPKGSEVPVKITGTYRHPSFGLDLSGGKTSPTSKELQRLYQGSK